MNNKLMNYQTKSTLSIISCTEKKKRKKWNLFESANPGTGSKNPDPDPHQNEAETLDYID